MGKPQQFGCKKCQSVFTVEMRAASDRVEVKVKDARLQERSDEVEIRCKRCSSAVARISFELA